MDPAASRSTVTRLTPSGWTGGDPRAVAWATDLSRRIAERCGPAGLRMQVASYRVLGREALAVDIDGPRGCWSMQFHAERGAAATTLDDSDVTVPDLVEAIHLASMLAHLLGAAADLGWAAEFDRRVPKLKDQETQMATFYVIRHTRTLRASDIFGHVAVDGPQDYEITLAGTYQGAKKPRVGFSEAQIYTEAGAQRQVRKSMELGYPRDVMQVIPIDIPMPGIGGVEGDSPASSNAGSEPDEANGADSVLDAQLTKLLNAAEQEIDGVAGEDATRSNRLVNDVLYAIRHIAYSRRNLAIGDAALHALHQRADVLMGRLHSGLPIDSQEPSTTAGATVSDTQTRLPDELVTRASKVMGDAFIAIRSATHGRYNHGERLTPERIAAIGTLADALHNMPGWIDADRSGRWQADQAMVREEVEVAVGAIAVLRGGHSPAVG